MSNNQNRIASKRLLPNELLEKIHSSIRYKCQKLSTINASAGECYNASIKIDDKWIFGNGETEKDAIFATLKCALTKIAAINPFELKMSKPTSHLLYQLPTFFPCTIEIIDNKTISITLNWNDITISEKGSVIRDTKICVFSKLITMGILLKGTPKMDNKSTLVSNIQNKNEQQLLTPIMSNNVDISLLPSKYISKSYKETIGAALRILPKIFEVIKFDIEYVCNLLNGANSFKASLMFDNKNYSALGSNEELAKFEVMKSVLMDIRSMNYLSIIKTPISHMVYQFMKCVVFNCETINKQNRFIYRAIIVIKDQIFYGEDEDLRYARVNVIAQILTSNKNNVSLISNNSKIITNNDNFDISELPSTSKATHDEVLTTITSTSTNNDVKHKTLITGEIFINSLSKIIVGKENYELLTRSMLLNLRPQNESYNFQKSTGIAVQLLTQILAIIKYDVRQLNESSLHKLFIASLKFQDIGSEGFASNRNSAQLITLKNTIQKVTALQCIGRTSNKPISQMLSQFINGLSLNLENIYKNSILFCSIIYAKIDGNQLNATNILIPTFGIAVDKLTKIQKALKYTITNVSIIPYKATILAALNVETIHCINFGDNEEMAKFEVTKFLLFLINIMIAESEKIPVSPIIKMIYQFSNDVIFNDNIISENPLIWQTIVIIDGKHYTHECDCKLNSRLNVLVKILTDNTKNNPLGNSTNLLNMIDNKASIGKIQLNEKSTKSPKFKASDNIISNNVKESQRSKQDILLNKINQAITYSYVTPSDASEKNFHVTAKIDGWTYQGKGNNEEIAKLNAIINAIQDITRYFNSQSADSTKYPIAFLIYKLRLSFSYEINGNKIIGRGYDVAYTRLTIFAQAIVNLNLANNENKSNDVDHKFPSQAAIPILKSPSGYENLCNGEIKQRNSYKSDLFVRSSTRPNAIDPDYICKIASSSYILKYYHQILKSLTYDIQIATDANGISTWKVVLNVDDKKYVGNGLSEEAAKIDAMKFVILHIRSLGNILRMQTLSSLIYRFISGFVCKSKYLTRNTEYIIVMINQTIFYGIGENSTLARIDVLAKILTNYKSSRNDKIMIENSLPSPPAIILTSEVTSPPTQLPSFSSTSRSPSFTSIFAEPFKKAQFSDINQINSNKYVSPSTSKKSQDINAAIIVNNSSVPKTNLKYIRPTTARTILELYENIFKSITYDTKHVTDNTSAWIVTLKIDNHEYIGKGLNEESAKIVAMKCVINKSRIIQLGRSPTIEMIFRCTSGFIYNEEILNTVPIAYLVTAKLYNRIYKAKDNCIEAAKLTVAAKILTNCFSTEQSDRTSETRKINISENSNNENVTEPSTCSTTLQTPENNHNNSVPNNLSFQKVLHKIMKDSKSITSDTNKTILDIFNDILKVIKYNIVMLPKPDNPCNFKVTLMIDNATYEAIDISPKRAKIKAMKAFFTELANIDKCCHEILPNRPTAYLMLKIESEFIYNKLKAIENNEHIEMLYAVINKNTYVGLVSTNQLLAKLDVLAKIFTNYNILDDINEIDAIREQQNIPIINANNLLKKLTNNNNIEFTLISKNGSSGPFKMKTIIEQLEFTGIAGNLVDAKQAVIKSALSALYNISYSSIRFLINNNLTFNNTLELSQTFADYIQKLIVDKFTQITNGFDYYKQRTVVAGIVMIENSDITTAKVINVTTGTRSINGEHLCLNGTVINDSHAEILSRRCLLDYFYQQLHLLQFSDTAKLSIFIKSPNCENKFQIKENIKFHLFISKSPCGECSLDISGHCSRKFNGELRAKIEAGEGTCIIDSKYNMQTWDGIKKGERLLTMSCSDKILKWNVVGLQGSLLASIIKPVYLESISIGSSFKGLNMYRAICGRIENNLRNLPLNYHLNKPKINMSISIVKRNTNLSHITPDFGTIWSYGWSSIEYINYNTGKTQNRLKSNVCKEALFKKYIQLSNTLFGINKSENFYYDRKLLSTQYQTAKEELFATLSRQKLGNWIKKPIEQDQFSQ